MGVGKKCLTEGDAFGEAHGLSALAALIEAEQPSMLEPLGELCLHADRAGWVEARPHPNAEAVSVLTDRDGLTVLEVFRVPAMTQAARIRLLLTPFFVMLIPGLTSEYGALRAIIGHLDGEGAHWSRC